MKIAIDTWTLASRFRHQGTYVYARSLAAEFLRIAAARTDLTMCLFRGANGSNDAGLTAPAPGAEFSRTAWLDHQHLWRLGGMSLAAGRARADLVFAPTASLLHLGPLPLVCTIHDLTPVLMPSHSRNATLELRAFSWFAVMRARAIITDSENSRGDLMRFYGLPLSRIFVVHLGFDKNVFNDRGPDSESQKALLLKLGVQRPYIVHHGTIQPRKNLARLIEAWRLLLARNRNLQFDLVLAGQPGWGFEEVLAAAARPAPANGRVVLTGSLEDSDLALLVKGAALAVAPSLYEGFCLPLVESMACGTPTIAANSSCLPEVSGGVLRYFDPGSAEEIAACMEETLENEALRKDLSRKGIERAAHFDWARCAAETLAVLESVLA